MGKTGWAQGQIRDARGVILPCGAQNCFAHSRADCELTHKLFRRAYFVTLFFQNNGKNLKFSHKSPKSPQYWSKAEIRPWWYRASSIKNPYTLHAILTSCLCLHPDLSGLNSVFRILYSDYKNNVATWRDT